MPEQTTNLKLPIPLGNENVNRQFFVDLIQAIDSGAVSQEKLTEQVKQITEGKQNVLRLADNYLAASVLVNAAADAQGRTYPDGMSLFKVTSAVGGWPTSSGYVLTMRAGDSGQQMFYETYAGTVQSDKTARQWTRSKRDGNGFWQEWARGLTENDLLDYVRQPGYAATSGTGAAYTMALNPQPTALVDGLSITIVPHTVNTVADPTLKIGNLAPLPIRRQTGATFAVGTIKAGAPLALVKVGSYFLARSAPAIGTATAAQVLAGKTFQSEAAPDGAAGTIPTLSGVRSATGTAKWGNGDLAVYMEQNAYFSGTEMRVSVAQLQAADGDLWAPNIKSGIEIFGIVGNMPIINQFTQTVNYTGYGVKVPVNFGFVPKIITVSDDTAPNSEPRMASMVLRPNGTYAKNEWFVRTNNMPSNVYQFLNNAGEFAEVTAAQMQIHFINSNVASTTIRAYG
ncbi:hypothetical protein B9G55_18855 [Saccharibacillus sp. O16]|nr:hypothetical protein B9G55_18855 [Saccharibacillus sp. O16]